MGTVRSVSRETACPCDFPAGYRLHGVQARSAPSKRPTRPDRKTPVLTVGLPVRAFGRRSRKARTITSRRLRPLKPVLPVLSDVDRIGPERRAARETDPAAVVRGERLLVGAVLREPSDGDHHLVVIAERPQA